MPCFRPFFDIAVVAEVPALSILQTIESIAALRHSAPVIYSFNTDRETAAPILIGCTEARMGAGQTLSQKYSERAGCGRQERGGARSPVPADRKSAAKLWRPISSVCVGNRLPAGSVSRGRGSSLCLLAYSVFSPFWGSGLAVAAWFLPSVQDISFLRKSHRADSGLAGAPMGRL